MRRLLQTTPTVLSSTITTLSFRPIWMRRGGLGLAVIKTPIRSPKANALCERLIGTLRHECLDWIIPLTEEHLHNTLMSWLPHYNRGRPHSSLEAGIPDPPAFPMQLHRYRHRFDQSTHIVARPILNGLHHEYTPFGPCCLSVAEFLRITGQMLTGSFMDYLGPTSTEAPNVEFGHIETLTPLTVGGIKGMGEGGAIAPPGAIANAVVDALAPFGVKFTELPLTPNRVWDTIRKAREKK